MRNPAERFWAKVNVGKDCWQWVGSRAGPEPQYGNFSVGRGRLFRAHRFAYLLAVGPIPDGLCVLHHCDNRLCVRPDHLFLGTKAENSADMVSKGRQAFHERHPGAKITMADAREIRRRGKRGDRQRVIASDFGLSQVAVSKILRGITWQEAA